MALSLEERRQRNIEDNKRILAELGLLKPNFILSAQPERSKQEKRKRDDGEKPKVKRRKYIMNIDESLMPEDAQGLVDHDNNRIYRRRSRRLQGQECKGETEKENMEDNLDDSDEQENSDSERRKSLLNRPMVYGSIPGVKVGTVWQTRIEANRAGVHRPTVAGIHGGPEGTYSIALSGGYEDDIDLGDCFTYTGEGGRDLKGTKTNPKNLRTAAQSKDQSLSKGNESLVKSVETGLPVRVVRGYKLRSVYAPEDGYRYDGLFKVEKWWYTTGLAGFGVYKFALRRLLDQDPAPWTLAQSSVEEADGTHNEASEGTPSKNNKESTDSDVTLGSSTSSMKPKSPASAIDQNVTDPEQRSLDAEQSSVDSEKSPDNMNQSSPSVKLD